MKWLVLPLENIEMEETEEVVCDQDDAHQNNKQHHQINRRKPFHYVGRFFHRHVVDTFLRNIWDLSAELKVLT